MKRTIIAILAVMAYTCAAAQSGKPAYVLYDGSGKPATYEQMIKDFSKADVVFIGEYHNDPIAHWMEIEITTSLYEAKKGKLVLGAEMFEADTQLMVDEYVGGVISTSRFEADCRLWHNYSTDYEPLVSFAQENELPFIATNIPRRYAELVNRSGGADVLETLSDEAKSYMAPLPMPFKSDSLMLSEGGIMSVLSDNPLAIAKAQAVKDATMAWRISQNMKKGTVFIHYNGSFHSDFNDGIIYFLEQYSPGVKIKTFSTVKQEDIMEFDKEAYEGIADYVICVPYTMTRTY